MSRLPCRYYPAGRVSHATVCTVLVYSGSLRCGAIELIKASGIDPGKAAQAHHIFPVQHGKEFIKAGIDMNKYGAWWETGSHLKNAYQYNEAWRAFFRPGFNPTQQEILQEAIRLKAFYGY